MYYVLNTNFINPFFINYENNYIFNIQITLLCHLVKNCLIYIKHVQINIKQNM